MFHEIHPLCKLPVANLYDDQLITRGLVGHWDAGDFSEPGTTWENRITDGKHLYLINGTQHTPSAGPNDVAFFTCDGTDDYIGAAVGAYAAPAFTLDNAQGFTICFWVNVTLLPHTDRHHFLTTGIITGSPVVTNGLQLGLGVSGNLMISYFSQGQTLVEFMTFPVSTSLGLLDSAGETKWYMISVVKNDIETNIDPAGERCYFFRNDLYCPISDNNPVSTDQYTTEGWERDIEEALVGTTAIEFGRMHNGNGYYYTAEGTAFSKIMIYDRDLLHSEIISNFNATKGKFRY